MLFSDKAVQAVNELTGVVQRDDAQLGVLICFDATRRMLQDAAGSGMVQTAQGRFQRIQIATVEDLLAGRHPAMPAALETDAFRQPLRSRRRAVIERPDAQLTLALPIPGRKKSPEVEDHLSGDLLAVISGS
jgi:hypothetical protein